MSGQNESPESRHARLAVAGILMDLLEMSAFEACRAAETASDDARQAIIRAARWPIRAQAQAAVKHHFERMCALLPAA